MKYFIILIFIFSLVGCVSLEIPVPESVNAPNKEYIKQKEQRSYDELDKETKK